MDEDIEISINIPGGIADCRLEPVIDDSELVAYSATILYPNMVNGYIRSGIYCHTMARNNASGIFSFDNGQDDIDPKIKQLEAQLADAIKQHLLKGGYR